MGQNILRGVEVDAQFREEMIEKLHTKGVHELNGKKIEDVIVAREPVVLGSAIAKGLNHE